METVRLSLVLAACSIYVLQSDATPFQPRPEMGDALPIRLEEMAEQPSHNNIDRAALMGQMSSPFWPDQLELWPEQKQKRNVHFYGSWGKKSAYGGGMWTRERRRFNYMPSRG